MPKTSAVAADSRDASTVSPPVKEAEKEKQVLGLADLFGTLEESEDWVKAIFYGREGSTKTTALARAVNLPGDGVVVFINAESGLKKAALAQYVDINKIMFWPKKDEKTGVIPKITRQLLEDLLLQLKGLTAANPAAVKAVGMDSLTEIVNLAMEEITEEAFIASQENSKLAHRDNKNDAQLKDYGQLTADVRMLLRGFRDLPCHFVATALEKELDLGGEVKELAPELTPKLATSVLGYMDVVVHFVSETIETEDGVTRLITGQTGPTTRVRCKDRFNVLPFLMADPSFDRIVQYVQGDIVRTADPLSSEYEHLRDQAAEFVKAKKAARMARNKA